MTTRVFTYGTLLPGQANAPLIEGAAERCIDAEVAGLALCAAPGVSYPFAVERQGHRIRGAVYEFNDDTRERVLTALDRLEGFDSDDQDRSLYLRRRWTAVVIGSRPRGFLPVVLYIAGPAAPSGLVDLDVTCWTDRRLV